jgi:hypothetical protein
MALTALPGERVLNVQVQEDFVEKLAAARPAQALAELIWNGLDAEATEVRVESELGPLGQTAIRVTDNGHGMPYEEVEALFANIGGSWKRSSERSKNGKRMLHGKEGRGRFRALALGRVAEWNVIAPSPDGNNVQYKITLIIDSARSVRIGKPHSLPPNAQTGVEVKIIEPYKDWQLSAPGLIQELCEIYALYLTDYPTARIDVAGSRLDPSTLIQLRKTFTLPAIPDGDKALNTTLEVVEWKTRTERMLYLCSTDGFPLHRIAPSIQAPGFEFSAYLRSEYVEQLHAAGVLDLAEMDTRLLASVNEAREELRKHFRARAIENAKTLLDAWKDERVYPYNDEPTNAVQAAERKVFDIVAVNVASSLPEFQSVDAKNRRFQLRMLRQAIERSPEELQLIVGEVLGLPKKKQKELARLLQRTTLSSIISAAKLVADRLDFLLGLEAMLFDSELKKTFKERSQLHRILADNTWVFGEEFALTVSDQSLTEVLRRHLELLGQEIAIDEPVKRLDDSVGIIDLMLSRRVPSAREDEHEHLIVELKAPKVKIGMKETNQIKSYAFAVVEDERFRSVPTRWTFWAVSNELDQFARNEVKEANKPEGLLWESTDRQCNIWVKTWAQILRDCRTRLQLFQKELNHNVDKGASLALLNETYERILKGKDLDSSTDEDATEPEEKNPPTPG